MQNRPNTPAAIPLMRVDPPEPSRLPDLSEVARPLSESDSKPVLLTVKHQRPASFRDDFALPPNAQFPRMANRMSQAEGVMLASAEEEIVEPPAPRLKEDDSESTPNQIRMPETPPAPPELGNETLKIPLARTPSPEAIQMDMQDGLVTIVARDAPLGDILTLLAQKQGFNLISGEDIKSRITITLNRVPIQNALANILAISGYTAVRQDDMLLITNIAAADNKVSSAAQGRVVEVFRLDYTSGTDVNAIVKGLLSPVGQSFVSQTKDSDNRKTQEVLVVEDVPTNLERIARTVQELDVAPRQVLIEAHILSVDLKDDMKTGVNLSVLANADPAITIKTDGFADAAAYATPGTTQAFFFNLSSKNVNQLVQALQTTSNAKTLASPKVFAVNGQQAKIQIGGQIGYNLVTTTQTSTMQSVNFLNVGVILTVTPQITPDNRILMRVKPEVSSGQINAKTNLPDTKTTQVETSVMLPDDHGIVIGGLIQEEDTDNQTKVPFLGDLWLIGRFFQHHETHRSRQEVIISIVPHIVPYSPPIDAREGQEFVRTTTPLLQGPLERHPRPWEPNLRDASQPPPFFSRKKDCGNASATSVQTVPAMQGEATIRREESPPLPPMNYERIPTPSGERPATF